MLPADHADRVKLFEERVKHWLSVGAKPTERVERILGRAGIVEMPAIPNQTKSAQPKAKAQDRLKAAQAAAEEAASASRAGTKHGRAGRSRRSAAPPRPRPVGSA